MAEGTNLKKHVLVLNMEQQMEEVAKEMFGKSLEELSNQEAYYVLLTYTKRLMTVSNHND